VLQEALLAMVEQEPHHLFQVHLLPILAAVVVVDG
jgi:hypothetical protein